MNLSMETIRKHNNKNQVQVRIQGHFRSAILIPLHYVIKLVVLIKNFFRKIVLFEKKMNRFTLLFLLFFSNQVFASVEGETLICNKDTRGYHFISDNKVKISSINLNELKISSVNHLYELTESKILIKQPFFSLPKEESLTNRAIGWIFRRNLDYVSLNYNNGDWNRKFSWTCEITSLSQLQLRINEKLNKLIKVNHKSLY
jgi:hypothetical protein